MERKPPESFEEARRKAGLSSAPPTREVRVTTVRTGPLATDPPLLRWFDSDHLPDPLQGIVTPFRDAALHLIDTTMPCPERTYSLRMLLIAKDAAVRAKIETLEQEDL